MDFLIVHFFENGSLEQAAEGGGAPVGSRREGAIERAANGVVIDGPTPINKELHKKPEAT